MSDETKSVKIDGVEIKNSRRVSFTFAVIISLIAFSTGVLAYHYIFTILPQMPGCVQISVKNTDSQAASGVNVEIYMSVFSGTGEKIAEAYTDVGGKVRFCGIFEPNKDYEVKVYDSVGNKLWSGYFATNEKSTADFPIIVRQ